MLFFLLVVGWGQAALAQTFDSEFKTWRVFSLVREQQKICYVTSSPVHKRRGTPYVVVTSRGKNPAEISVSAGYPYKSKSTVDLRIDAQPPHALFTTSKTPQIAWARDAAEDKQVVKEMLKGVTMTVTGQAQTQASSTDTYALHGFSRAYKRMQELCKAGPARPQAGKPRSR
jgi:invasion protein IalB